MSHEFLINKQVYFHEEIKCESTVTGIPRGRAGRISTWHFHPEVDLGRWGTLSKQELFIQKKKDLFFIKMGPW